MTKRERQRELRAYARDYLGAKRLPDEVSERLDALAESPYRDMPIAAINAMLRRRRVADAD
jgi:hypothetical protein